MLCVHRKAADVRWRFLPFFVISVTVLSALANEETTTLQAASETVTINSLAENTTLLTESTLAFNETSTLKPPEVSTKSVDIPTEIPEGRTESSEVASAKVEVPVISDAETAGKQEGTVGKRQVTDKTHNEATEKSGVAVEEEVTVGKRQVVDKTHNEATEKSGVAVEEEVTVEKRQLTDEKREETSTEDGDVTADMAGKPVKEDVVTAGKRDETVKSVEITTEKLQDEEIQTESASELALQSVQLAVVVRAPKPHGEKISSGNSTGGFEQEDEYGGVEGSDNGEDDDDDMEDDDEHGMIDYEDDEDDSKNPSEISATVVSSTVVSSTESSSTSTTSPPPTTASPPDDKVDVELIKEVTSEVSPSTVPAPRRPRHSQSGDYDYGNSATTTLRPRRRRPNRYKDERRVPYKDERRVPYRDGYYPGRSLKRRKTTKERPVKATSTLAPIQTTTESYLKRFNQIEQDTEKPLPTTPQVPQRRPKRRKKKVRRQKQSKPQERQVPLETRTAIEAAAAAVAAESLRSDAFPSASTTLSTERLLTTIGPRSVRQNDADVSIQQSEVNPDGSYSFSYDVVDEGRQSRSEDGTPDQVVVGKYSFIDANGRTVKRVYSAGPRGFRAAGTDIARKMDLSQQGLAPIPPPDGRYSPEYDRYSDPNEDPSYKFQYQTNTASRKEEADSRGDVKGQYSFFDDDGEEHVVKYYAGAEQGFNVKTAFPDNRIPPGFYFPGRGRVPPRGRSTILQHRNGAYRFTAVGPDSRREECSDSMNYRRGSYAYLDDKGRERTVVYEAGPNIGYRIIPNPAAIPRCPPSVGSRGWENIPVQVGVDPPYYGPSTAGFGAQSPMSTFRPWPYPPDPEIDTGDTTYPLKPWPSTTRPAGRPSTTRPGVRPETSRPGVRPTTPQPDDRNPPKPSIPRPSLTPGPGTPSTTYRPPGSTPQGPNASLPPLGTSQSKPSCPNGDCSPGNMPSDGSSWSPAGSSNGGSQIGSTDKPPRRPGVGSSTGNRVGGEQSLNPKFDETFNTTLINRYPVSISPAPPSPGGGRPPGGGTTTITGRPPGDGVASGDHRPLPSPYPPYHHFSCCRDRLFVDSAQDDHVGRARPIRTYVQSIDISENDENGPGRAENPSVALERHVREHELKSSRRQRRRRRRRRRSAP